ncbi:PKHD-type hydroxylase [Tenacibaculum sp. 190524A02b]|uniref:PKHD-type hydroxylase n=1 Tax=Tenacibaculum vairaonense TaxID=3137860 RepID=A0ABP1F6L5_9FLAO
MSFLIQEKKHNAIGGWHFEPEAFSEEEIEKIHQLADKLDFKKAVLASGSNNNDEYRKSEIKWLTTQMEGVYWLYQKFADISIKANNKLWQFDLTGMLENIQYGIYRSDGGHYDWHMDVGGGSTHKRKISIVLQLSDPEEYEGGELEMFVSKDVQKIPKIKGAVLLFPSYYMHRVTPVTKGERRSIVLWVSGPPLR